MGRFFRAAVHADHPLRDIDTDMPGDLAAAIKLASEMGERITQWRADCLARFEQISESLRPYSAQLMQNVDN